MENSPDMRGHRAQARCSPVRPARRARASVRGRLVVALAGLGFALALAPPAAAALSFSPATNFAAGGAPFSVATGDFDGDGRLDLAVANLVTMNATRPAGAVVTYAATASDVVDGPIAPTCAPASGSTFPIGHTMVSCTAMDAHSNRSAPSFFDVFVNGAAAQLDDVSDLIDSFNLTKKQEKKFKNELRDASKHLSKGQIKQTCHELDEFLKKVGKETGKRLTEDEARQLTDAARRIQAVIRS